ncbi:Low molecular weight protein-tyrosine-phosphatase [Musa troglodytarum]|uniref:acid phosphatase n=1 Tax=Musa troglodytarum TaxID=320322 RepID=A0A9E7F7L3_9LILI|nr:Low molecular weight protein-tyrosine-phosphatase [Musa troglodytarum]
MAETEPFSVLFVCLGTLSRFPKSISYSGSSDFSLADLLSGNICRSPAAEAVFTDLVRKRGAESKFKIDSAGTIGFHEGNSADPRMRAAAKRRGIDVTSISRPIRPSDFREFDLILAMDMRNREDILSAYGRRRSKEPLPEDASKKVKLMCSFCKKHNEAEVPDPYYGGPQGFEKVLDLLEDACESLFDSIMAEKSQTSVSAAELEVSILDRDLPWRLSIHEESICNQNTVHGIR